MLRMWQLPEAESQFGEVVDEAISHGPQLIAKRGAEAAILLSYTEYGKLVVKQQKLSAFFHESPLAEAALDLRRDASGPRAEMDLLIAATALHGNFNLVTRNEIDFQSAGVLLTNPWK